MGKARKEARTDRTARLLKVEHILYQNRHGIKVEDIAHMCSVNKRTTYRDLIALESELGLPVWEDGTKRGIQEGYILPPIRFTLPEAMRIFMAARLMLNYSHRYDPEVASVFQKLNSVVPATLRDEIRKTLAWMQKHPKNERYLRTLSILVDAWVFRRQVKITYRSLEAEHASTRIIEPYFIEPAAGGHSNYVIAFCHRTNSLRTFKIERIKTIETTVTPYKIPSDFEANEYFGSSLGVTVEGEPKIIKLRLTPGLARIMEETTWHPSQGLEKNRDGSIIMTLRVGYTAEVFSWILQWGDGVEVLGPEDVREDIVHAAKAILDAYGEKAGS